MKTASERERLRLETRRRREGLSSEARARGSESIVEAVVPWIAHNNFRSVMLYLSMRCEVQTDALLKRLLDSESQVCAPAVDSESLNLVPRRIRDPRTDLVRHRYGMLEPRAACPDFPTDRIQLIVVPGIAFDRNGYRLGYGGGFYDRFLVKCPHAVAIGLAYQTQLVADTFPQRWDVPVQHIFTEAGRIDVSLTLHQ